MANEVVNVDKSGEVVESPYILPLKNPIMFEGKRYDRIDLTGLENIRAADMIAVNHRLNGVGYVDFLQENSMEYALNLASIASELPIEFFYQLKPGTAMRVKKCVSSFLYGQE